MPELRCGRPALDRQVRGLRRVEHHRRGSAGSARAGLGPGQVLQGTRRRAAPVVRHRGRQDRAHADGPRRARSRDRRRHRAGFRAADRRRARHRQIDAAAAGGRGLRRGRAARRLLHRRGGDGPGAPARRAAGAGARPAGARQRDQLVQHPGDAGRGQARRPRRDRFDPDAVGRWPRSRARHGQPGAGCHPVAGPLRQGGGLGAACLSGTSPRTARSPARR